MADVANLRVRFGIDGVDSVTRGAQQVEKSVSGVVGSVGKIAGGFVLGNVINKVGQELAGLGRNILDFDGQMRNVDSLAQTTGAEFDRLKLQVLGLANDPAIRQGPELLAAGLYQVNSSGFQGAAGLTILESSAKAASAGLTTTEVAATAATAVLNAYGMGADQVNHVNDVMFQTVNSGVLTYEQLATNMGSVLPIASAMGVSIEEIGASYATMTLQGMNASAAETGLVNVLKAAANPTDALTQLMQEHNYTSAQAAIQQEGLAGFLDLVTEAAGGDQKVLYDLLSTQEAVNAVTALGTDEGKKYTDNLNAMNKASRGVGATQKALDRQMKAANYQWDLFTKNIKIGAIASLELFGGSIAGVISPLVSFTGGLNDVLLYLNDVTLGANRFGDSFEKIPEPLRRAAAGLALVVDGLGDTYRAFQSGGFQRAIDELGRIQGDRILSGLTTIGEEAWGAFKGAIEGAAAEGIDLATLVVRGTPKLADTVLNGAGDLYGWFLNEIGLGSGSAAPDPAMGFQQLADVGRSRDPIDFGDIVVAAGLTLTGLAKEAAGDLYGWVVGQVSGTSTVALPGIGGSQGQISVANPPIPLGDIVIDAGLALIGQAKEWAGRLGDWVGRQLTSGWDKTVDLGSMMIHAVPDLASDIWGAGGDFAGWAGPKIRAGVTGAIEIGTVLLDGALDLGGDLLAAAGDLSTTIGPKLRAGWDGIVDIGTIALDVAEIKIENITGWAGNALGDIQTWVDDNYPGGVTSAIQITALKPVFDNLESGDWKASIKAFIEADPIDVTPQIEMNIHDAVENWVRDQSEQGAQDPIGTAIDVGKVAALIGGAVFVGLPAALGTYFVTKVAPDVTRVMRATFTGMFDGLFSGGTEAWQPGMDPSEMGMVNDGVLQPIIDEIKSIPGKIADAFTGWDWPDITFPDIPWPDVSDVTDNIPQWIKDFVSMNPLDFARKYVLGGGGGGGAASYGAVAGGFNRPELNAPPEIPSFAPGGGGVDLTVGIAPIIDQTALDGVRQSIVEAIGGEGDSVKASLGIDTTEFFAGFTAVNNVLSIFQTSPYTGHLYGDSAPFFGVFQGVNNVLTTFQTMEPTVHLYAEDHVSSVVDDVITKLGEMPTSKTVSINTVNTSTTVPGRATGGLIREPLTLVGERGPELISSPGSYVYTAGQTAGMLRGGGDTNYFIKVEVNGDNYGDAHIERKVESVVRKNLVPALQRRRISQGVN